MPVIELRGNVSNYLVDLGHFFGRESHDFPGNPNIIWIFKIRTQKWTVPK